MFDALEWRSKVEFRPGHAPTARQYDFCANSYDFYVSLLKISVLSMAKVPPM